LSQSSRRVALLLLASLTTSALLAAQAPGRPTTGAQGAAAPAGAAVPASPYRAQQRSPADSAYIAVLENVNQQLALRWEPVNVIVTLMAVVVAVLGLVFAGGTVMAGWLLYRQSSEFREQSAQSIREHRAILGAIVESWRRETDAAFAAKMAEYDQSIVEQQAKLDHLTGASAEQRQQVERDIERLKRERDAASASELEKFGAAVAASPLHAGRRSQQIAAPPALDLGASFAVPGKRMSSHSIPQRRFCTSCGEEFLLGEEPAGTMERSSTGTREVYCTNCGAKNHV
jgi:hypothetical protein